MKKRLYLFILLLLLAPVLGACGREGNGDAPTVPSAEVNFDALSLTGTMDLSYAAQFGVERYGEYALVTVIDSGRFFLVPEGAAVPSNLPGDVTVLKQPLDRAYLVSTSAMDLICAAGGLSSLRLSGTREDGWHVDEAAKAMERGDLLYAGKYNAPDYERILKEGCNLAIENTMIYHNPEVKEKLEELGIPVLVERSSYEGDPLGRLEWIKLYGLLFGKEAEAEAFFEEKMEKLSSILGDTESGLTAAFFYVTSNGAVNVRKPGDYIVRMIEYAGGEYVLKDLAVPEEKKNALSTMNMQMEDFYAAAKDADVLIYNSTIDGELSDLGDLIRIDALFADFRAVRSGEVYCTGSDFFQKTTGVCEFIEDLNRIFTKEGTDEYTYLKKLR